MTARHEPPRRERDIARTRPLVLAVTLLVAAPSIAGSGGGGDKKPKKAKGEPTEATARLVSGDEMEEIRRKVTEIINGRSHFSFDWRDSYRYDGLGRLTGAGRCESPHRSVAIRPAATRRAFRTRRPSLPPTAPARRSTRKPGSISSSSR